MMYGGWLITSRLRLQLNEINSLLSSLVAVINFAHSAVVFDHFLCTFTHMASLRKKYLRDVGGHARSLVSVPSVVRARWERWGAAGLGGEGPRDGSGGPADVNGAGVSVWWVAVPVFDLGQGWAGVHGVPVAGGGNDRELVNGAGVGPTPVFLPLITA